MPENLTADEASELLALLRKAQADPTMPAWVRDEHLGPVINWAGARLDALRHGTGVG